MRLEIRSLCLERMQYKDLLEHTACLEPDVKFMTIRVAAVVPLADFNMAGPAGKACFVKAVSGQEKRNLHVLPQVVHPTERAVHPHLLVWSVFRHIRPALLILTGGPANDKPPVELVCSSKRSCCNPAAGASLWRKELFCQAAFV